MAKTKESPEEKDKLQATLDKLNKTYGIGTVLSLDSDSVGDYDVISSGSIAFDHKVLGVGGFVKGKLYELMGWEGCIESSTYVKFNIVSETNRLQHFMGGTIKELYRKFHHRTKKTKNSIFEVTSIDENNKLFYNKIADVVKSGIKECFEVTTERGHRLSVTKDHKIFTGEEYIPLEKLNIGDVIISTKFDGGYSYSEMCATPDKIVSIVSIGRKSTYDIKCFAPYNNYIVSGIVVHNSGKSTICGTAVAECQAKGGTALYVDGEHAVDKNYFQALGVDTSKMLLCQANSGEEGFNVALELINTGKIDLVIIDSDSSLIPQKVVDGEIGDSAIGRKALLNSNAYPKLKNALVSHKTCVIVISQYREKIGVMFGSPVTTQGGHALKFYSDVRIEISKSLGKDGDVVYGNITKIKCVKNKMCSPFRTCQFDIIYGQGIDRLAELIAIASDFDIIQKSGSWYSYGETKLGQGTDGVTQLLLDNPELQDEIRQQVIEMLKSNK